MTHELDAELARWLRVRTVLRASRDRDASALDDVAVALRRLRSQLSAMSSATHEEEEEHGAGNLVARTYRWAIRVARELDTIERLALDAMLEWTRFEAFAPFALAFFDSAVAPAFVGVHTTDAARLRRDLESVLSPLMLARTSSALAA